jgi:hypothetical protein
MLDPMKFSGSDDADDRCDRTMGAAGAQSPFKGQIRTQAALTSECRVGLVVVSRVLCRLTRPFPCSRNPKVKPEREKERTTRYTFDFGRGDGGRKLESRTTGCTFKV